jgi:hypothetical protein
MTLRREDSFKRVHRLLRVEKLSTFAVPALSILMNGGQAHYPKLRFGSVEAGDAIRRRAKAAPVFSTPLG